MEGGAGGIISPGHADARPGETIPRHLRNYQETSELRMYLKDRKFQESFDAFRKADEYNDGEGSFYLALFYIKGVMVPKNFKKAQEILYRSAGNGHKWAKDLLDKGFSHIEGVM